MTLGTLKDLIERLGGKVSENYASALKQAALNRVGRGSLYFDIDAVAAWRDAHPNWQITDRYPAKVRQSRPRTRKGRKVSNAGKAG